MSYTLRGRVESRLAALAPLLLAACALAGAIQRWWPVEAAALMVGLGLGLDALAFDRLLPYQPAWAALPLGALELGALLGAMRALDIQAPIGQALALFAGGWLLALVLGQARCSSALRLGYDQDGGELGLVGAVAGGAIVVALAGAAATAYALAPPVVHLAAGVYRGPLVITRREVLVGSPGTIVRGGIVVRANDVTIRNVAVVGGEDGISVTGVHGTILDGVSVSGARLDGIHVVFAGVVIKNCVVDMHGNPVGEGINISYNMGMGMSMVEGCTVVGGMEGITTHSSMTDIVDDRVSGTQQQGIAVTEMSMGTVRQDEVSDALGIGIYCNDRSTCVIEHDTVVGTGVGRRVGSGNPTRRGFRGAGLVPVAGRAAGECDRGQPGADGSRHQLADRGHTLDSTAGSTRRERAMPHIDLPAGLPGISGAFSFRPETARPLRLLAETLLRDDNSLGRGERELIAAYVSSLNRCAFCETSHSTFAAMQLDGGMPLVAQAKSNPEQAPISPKLRALLAVAAKVQAGGRSVTEDDRRGRGASRGATDVEIHDTVLIAAAFCMFNRYVDGLATWAPTDPATYEEIGRRIVERGYLVPPAPAAAAAGRGSSAAGIVAET